MIDFRRLMVWQKARSLTKDLYAVTSTFPRAELYGLTSQIRRAGSSITANIAEGCDRRSKAEFRHFLEIATGSTTELECHLILANDLGFLGEPALQALSGQVVEIGKMLLGLTRRLTSQIS